MRPQDNPEHLNVVLNTWLILYAHDPDMSTPKFGGLPNDFLSHGSASLFILDHIICDEDGFSTEAAVPWVSSHIFRQLKAEGLLRPRSYRKGYSKAVLDDLRETGLLSWAKHFMGDQLSRIRNGDVGTSELQLPSTLRWLNSVMFTGVDLPNALHYDYQEHHFGNLSLAANAITTAVAPRTRETEEAREQRSRTDRFMEALSIVVPNFSLLPPIVGPVLPRRHSVRTYGKRSA